MSPAPPPGAGPQRRTPRDELADATPLGGVYLRRLVRSQLALSLLALVAFGAVLGILPIVLYLVPALSETHVLGLPLAIAILVATPFPLLVLIGWLYTRRADALDRLFRELADDA